VPARSVQLSLSFPSQEEPNLELPRTPLHLLAPFKVIPLGKHQSDILINFFFFVLDAFSELTKGESLAQSRLARCIDCADDAQRKGSQKLSECCRKAYFPVNLFLEAAELFWLKLTV